MIFVDHYSRFTFVYLMKSIMSAETVQAKQAFESYSRSLGVHIHHYHADNGRFADNAFIQDYQQQKQSIIYCGVNAHWHNGLTEKRIQDLEDSTRAQLIHATHRWPQAATAHLWPYNLVYSYDIANSIINITTSEFHWIASPMYPSNQNFNITTPSSALYIS
mmetsp:Transcript_26587/g.37714  ORF Transcript_26587/g.37714 Transcript_26587/m.37714 type:complete len:162 (+) Transcript_26587:2-487(+)